MSGKITNRQTNLLKKQTTQEDDAASVNAAVSCCATRDDVPSDRCWTTAG